MNASFLKASNYVWWNFQSIADISHWKKKMKLLSSRLDNKERPNGQESNIFETKVKEEDRVWKV